MNDNVYAIPNWRDRAAYGDVSRWSYAQWRWQFRRRDPQYREDADRVIYATDADQRYQAWEAYFARWGYCDEALDPRQADYPEERLKTFALGGVKVMVGSVSSEEGLSGLHPRIGEIGFILRFDKPLTAQLEIVDKAFRKYKADLKAPNRKSVPTDGGQQWLSYLRLLDGIEAKERGLFNITENATAIWEACRCTESEVDATKALKAARRTGTKLS